MTKKEKILSYLFIGFIFMLSLLLIGTMTFLSLKVYDKQANADSSDIDFMLDFTSSNFVENDLSNYRNTNTISGGTIGYSSYTYKSTSTISNTSPLNLYMFTKNGFTNPYVFYTTLDFKPNTTYYYNCCFYMGNYSYSNPINIRVGSMYRSFGNYGFMSDNSSISIGRFVGSFTTSSSVSLANSTFYLGMTASSGSPYVIPLYFAVSYNDITNGIPTSISPEIREEIYQSGYNLGYDEGYSLGYDEGYSLAIDYSSNSIYSLKYNIGTSSLSSPYYSDFGTTGLYAPINTFHNINFSIKDIMENNNIYMSLSGVKYNDKVVDCPYVINKNYGSYGGDSSLSSLTFTCGNNTTIANSDFYIVLNIISSSYNSTLVKAYYSIYYVDNDLFKFLDPGSLDSCSLFIKNSDDNVLYDYYYNKVSGQIYDNAFNDGVTYSKTQIYPTSSSYISGYNEGLETSSNNSFLGLMSSVVNAPIKGMISLVDYEVDFLGINLKDLFVSLVGIALSISVVRLILKVF